MQSNGRKVERLHIIQWVACVSCVGGKTRAGSMVGGVAVVTGEWTDVSDNRTVTASVGDSAAVSRVVIDGEERCWPSCNRFGEIAVVPLFVGSCGSATSLSGLS